MVSSEELIKKAIFKHLPTDRYQVFLFGSRVSGQATAFSDYDVGVLGKEKVPLATLALIEEELEDSDLPYHVDVVDFRRVGGKFRRLAFRGRKLWSNPN